MTQERKHTIRQFLMLSEQKGRIGTALRAIRRKMKADGITDEWLTRNADAPFSAVKKEAGRIRTKRGVDESTRLVEGLTGPIAGEAATLKPTEAGLLPPRPRWARLPQHSPGDPDAWRDQGQAPRYRASERAMVLGLQDPEPSITRGAWGEPVESKIPEANRRRIAVAAKKVSKEEGAEAFDFLFKRLGPALVAGSAGEYGPFFTKERLRARFLAQMPEKIGAGVKEKRRKSRIKGRAPFIAAAGVLIPYLRGQGMFPPKIGDNIVGEGEIHSQFADVLMDDVQEGRHREWDPVWKDLVGHLIKGVRDLPFYMTQEDLDAGRTPDQAWKRRAKRLKLHQFQQPHIAGPSYAGPGGILEDPHADRRAIDRRERFRRIPPGPYRPLWVPTTETTLYRTGKSGHTEWPKGWMQAYGPDMDTVTGSPDPSFLENLGEGLKRSLGSHMAGFLDVTNTSNRQKWKEALGFTEKRIAERSKDPVVLNFLKNQKELVEGLIHLTGEIFGVMDDKQLEVVKGMYKQYLIDRGLPIRPLTRAEQGGLATASGGERLSQFILGAGAGLVKTFEDPIGSFQSDPLFTLMTFLGAARGLSSIAGLAKIKGLSTKMAQLRKISRDLERGLLATSYIKPVLKAGATLARKVPGAAKVGAVTTAIKDFMIRPVVSRLLGSLEDVEGMPSFFKGRLDAWRTKTKKKMDSEGEGFGNESLIESVADIQDGVVREQISAALLEDLNPTLHRQVAKGEVPGGFQQNLIEALRGREYGQTWLPVGDYAEAQLLRGTRPRFQGGRRMSAQEFLDQLKGSRQKERLAGYAELAEMRGAPRSPRDLSLESPGRPIAPTRGHVEVAPGGRDPLPGQLPMGGLREKGAGRAAAGALSGEAEFWRAVRERGLEKKRLSSDEWLAELAEQFEQGQPQARPRTGPAREPYRGEPPVSGEQVPLEGIPPGQLSLSEAPIPSRARASAPLEIAVGKKDIIGSRDIPKADIVAMTTAWDPPPIPQPKPIRVRKKDIIESEVIGEPQQPPPLPEGPTPGPTPAVERQRARLRQMTLEQLQETAKASGVPFVLALQENPGSLRITVQPGPGARAQAAVLRKRLKELIRDDVHARAEAKIRGRPVRDPETGETRWEGGAPARKLMDWAERKKLAELEAAMVAGRRALEDPGSHAVVMGVEGGVPVTPGLPTRPAQGRKAVQPEPEVAGALSFEIADMQPVPTGNPAKRAHLSQIIAGLESGNPFEVIAGSEAAAKWLSGIGKKAEGPAGPATGGAMPWPPLLSIFPYERVSAWLNKRQRRRAAEGAAADLDAIDAAQAVGLRSRLVGKGPSLSPEKRVALLRNIVNRSEVDGAKVVKQERAHLIQKELLLSEQILSGEVKGFKPGVVTREMLDAVPVDKRAALGLDKLVEATPETLRWLDQPEGARLLVEPGLNSAVRWSDWLDKTFAGKKSGFLRAAAANFKRALTSLNPLTFTTNLVSNLFLRAVVNGRRSPAELVRNVRAYRRYQRGGKVTELERAVFDQFDRRGWQDFTKTELQAAGGPHLLQALSDFAEKKWGAPGSMFSKLMTPANKTLAALEKLYRSSDIWFKIDQGLIMAKRLVDGADDLSNGQSVWFPLRKGTKVDVFKTPDGFRVGGMQGRRITRKELINMAADAGRFSADKLFFNYAKIPKFMQLMRKVGADALFSPFYTWFYKAMWVPGLKGGLGKEILHGGLRGVGSTNPNVHRRLSGDMANQVATRLAIVQSAQGTQMAYNDPDQSVVRALSAYGPQGEEPFIGLMWAGPGSLLSKFKTSGVDVSVNAPMRLLAEVERGVRGMRRTHPLLVGVAEDFGRRGSDQYAALDEILARAEKEKKKPSVREAAAMLRDPDRVAQLVEESRENFPSSGSVLADLFKTLGFDPGGVATVTFNVLKEWQSGKRPKDHDLETLLSVVAGSKAIPAIARKGLKGYLGYEELDVAEERRVGRQRLVGRLERLQRNWYGASEPHSADDINEEDDPTRARAMKVERQAMRMIIRAQINLAREKLIGSLRRMGYRVRLRKDGEIEFQSQLQERAEARGKERQAGIRRIEAGIKKLDQFIEVSPRSKAARKMRTGLKRSKKIEKHRIR